MKKLTLLLICLVAASASMAQSDSEPKLHFGLKVAPSLAWLRTDTKGLESDGSKFGFAYGLITDFKFADHYYFGTGIDIAYRGGKFKQAVTTDTGGVTTTTSSLASYTLQYIEVPITLKFKTNEIGYLTYFLQIGVAPGIPIRARSDYESTTQVTVGGSTTTSNASEENVDVLDDINNINFSMIIGAGVEYTLSGSTAMFAGLQFNNGFLDVFDAENEKVNSNYLALTLGVLF